MKRIVALLLGSFLLASSALAISDAPSAINYQGKLLNSAGSQVADGTYTIAFKLYNGASGATFLWGASYSVFVSGGYFNAILGEGGSAIPGGAYTTVTGALGNTSTPYLGLTILTDNTGANINNAQEISPRLRFLSSPYAVVAENAKYADGAAYATNAGTIGGLLPNQFLQPASTAATTLSGNISVPNLTVNTGSVLNGNTTLANVKVTGTLSAAATTGGGFVPVGAILMWSGDIGNIPSGWALCNGTGTFSVNGTTYSVPDLRDRFVVGAGNSYGKGGTGGNSSVTLGSNHIPRHRHTYKDTIASENNIAKSNNNPEGLDNGTDGGNNYVGIKGGADQDNSLSWVRRNSDYSQGNSSGGNDSFDIRPPYYALAFIIRLQ